MLKITQGYLCYCEKGELGLVTHEKKVKGFYKGIYLNNKKFGKPWQSKRPHIVAIIDLNNGNIKVPGATKIVELPNATVIKVIPPQEYGLVEIPNEEDED